MENLLECNICLEKYDSKEKMPRILKCGHTFCTKCLRELTRLSNNLDMNLPFVKCPLDKTIGHTNTNIEEIPINRIIVDILDFNGFQFDKLSLKEDKPNDQTTLINSVAEKLQNTENKYFSCSNSIRDSIHKFMNVKNNCITEISEHFNKMLNILETQKTTSIFQLEKYSKEKLTYFNQVLHSVENEKDNVHFKLSHLEMFKNQKKNLKLTVADELSVLTSLGIDNIESTELQEDIGNVLKEMQSDYLPKVVLQENSNIINLLLLKVDEQLVELINSAKVIIPKKDQSPELFNLNTDLEQLNINNCLFWFQQKTSNVYKKNLNEADWLLAENKDKFLFNEMFRVCMIGPEEALITGGGQGFVSSNATVLYKNGHFRKKQSMFRERRSHSSCKAGDFIFVCGGFNSKGESITSCEKFSLENENWVKVSNMAVAKSHLSLCNVNNQYIYSIGGENNVQSILDIVERHTINLDIWEVMTVRIPTKIECCACIQMNNDFLILGGYSCEKGSLNSVFLYDTTNNSIRQLNKDLSQPGWSIYQPMKVRSNIHVFYGGEEGYPPHHLIYEF